MLAASNVSCALQACFEEGLLSEAEYSAQCEALHLGAEPRRGKIGLVCLISVPVVAGFLLRFHGIRLLVFGLFVCFSV